MVLPCFANLPSAASSAGGAVSAAPPFCPPPAGGRPLLLIIFASALLRHNTKVDPAGSGPAAYDLPPCHTAGHMAVVAGAAPRPVVPSSRADHCHKDNSF